MQTLMRAAFHLATLRHDDITRVAIIIDSDTQIRTDAVIKLFYPWRAWLEITDTLVTNTSDSGTWKSWLEIAAANGTQAVSVVSDHSEFVDLFNNAAKNSGLPTLDSKYPTDTDRNAALFHEMSHHHFELGGLNEWNNASSVHGSSVLQHMSTANCVGHFPQYTIDELWARYATVGRQLEALDIGCGPISRLRWGALEDLLHITGVDPLLDLYQIILTHHGFDPLPSIRVDRALAVSAENLSDHVATESSDFAFSCNALDHVEDPPTVIAQVAQALRPSALFALEFATREGSRQKWRDLHKFDLFLDPDSNQLMCQGRDGHVDLLVRPNVPLSLSRVVANTVDQTVVILKKIDSQPSSASALGT